MIRRLGMAVCTAALLVSVPANAMSVNEFLTKAHALKAKGIFALASSDYRLLKGEVEKISTDYRARVAAERKAGHKPESCPPAAKMGSNEFLAEVEKVPPAQRGMSMESFFSQMMKRRYPCQA